MANKILGLVKVGGLGAILVQPGGLKRYYDRRLLPAGEFFAALTPQQEEALRAALRQGGFPKHATAPRATKK